MRYSIKKQGQATYSVYDNVRKCSIVKTISPNASYNEEVISEIVNLLNTGARADADSENTNYAIFDVSNLTIIGLLKLMNEYNRRTEQKIAIGFHSDGVGDICDFSHDVEILIKDFNTLNEAIQFLCE